MGTLVARKYRTALFLKLADHTYVECGTGAIGWSCWGGKTGGSPFHQGVGSTARANAIAEPNERAGITCYLINGVCHQAANRILFPAKILVTGARGYGVSQALYGPYGRPRGFLGFCQAPFQRHDQVTGDLSECQGQSAMGEGPPTSPDAASIRYINEAAAIYRKMPATILSDERQQDWEQVQKEIQDFQSALFSLMMEFRVGSEFASSYSATQMLGHLASTEGRRFEAEHSFAEGDMDVDDFVEQINTQILEFQTAAANTLDESDYQTLFDLPRDDQVILGDPSIAKAAFGSNQASK